MFLLQQQAIQPFAFLEVMSSLLAYCSNLSQAQIIAKTKQLHLSCLQTKTMQFFFVTKIERNNTAYEC